MPDLRTVLTETIDRHIGYLYGDTTADSATDGQVGGCTGCDWRGGGADHTAHLADVLLGLPGVAVTQLPEASDPTYPNEWSSRTDPPPDEWDTWLDGRGTIQIRTQGYATAEGARNLAAALLAAALSVEGNTNA